MEVFSRWQRDSGNRVHALEVGEASGKTVMDLLYKYHRYNNSCDYLQYSESYDRNNNSCEYPIQNESCCIKTTGTTTVVSTPDKTSHVV